MEDPRPAGGDAQEPVLYSAPASLPCQLVRLALVEKGVAHRVRNVNLGALEQVRRRCAPASERGNKSSQSFSARGLLGTTTHLAPATRPPAQHVEYRRRGGWRAGPSGSFA